MSTKHKLRATIPHGPEDIGAEVECEIAFTFLRGAAPIIHPADNADPGWPAEIEFIGAKPIIDGKPSLYSGAFADMQMEWLGELASNWLESDEGQAEAFATVREDDEAAREYAADLRADR